MEDAVVFLDKLIEARKRLSYIKGTCTVVGGLSDEAIHGLFLSLNDIEIALEIVEEGISRHIEGGG